MRKNKLLLLLALLLTAATGAWAQKQITINQGFEDGMGDWTMNHCHSNTEIIADNGYEGSKSFRFYYTANYPQYLISPELDENDGGTMSFYYARKSTSYDESFKVGYSTTTSEPSAFTWGNEQTVSNGDALTYFNFTYNFPAGTKYVSIACTSNDKYFFYVDAIKIEYVTVTPPLYVTMKDGVKDADKWTVKVGDGEAQALPIGGLKGDGSETVTLQYNGRLKVKSVTATSVAPPDPLATPLTIEAITDGTIVVNMSGTLTTGMKYSVNGGTKTTITSTTSIEGLKAGDKVQFYGNGTSTQVYGNSPNVKILGSGDGFKTKVYGNIMSLLDEEGFATKTDLPNAQFVFLGLFNGNTTLIDASELLLPATQLASSCYNQMFTNCTALTAAPALPATQLAEYCYFYMFYCCTALTTAPALPATELAPACYNQMFRGCTSLTAAPALPAPTLVSNCYNQMLYNCKKLATVTCLATSGINQSGSTNNWLYNAGSEVQGTKTFNAVSTAEWPSSDHGLPIGWTRVNIDN